MDIITNCKYCTNEINFILHEYLTCLICQEKSHVKCTRKGSVPGGLTGDVFFKYTCAECNSNDTELFVRDKMPWVQAITLVLYHMQARTPGLGRKGYFHWKTHISTFITKHWDTLFGKESKKRKKWMGTVSGTLSHHSPLIFSSGTSWINDQGWWTLTYPQLLPKVIGDIHSELITRKLKSKENKCSLMYTDVMLFERIASEKGVLPEYLTTVSNTEVPGNVDPKEEPSSDLEPLKKIKSDKSNRKASLLPSLEKFSEGPLKKYQKMDYFTLEQKDVSENASMEKQNTKRVVNFLDPYMHYNTSIKNITYTMGIKLSVKLTGAIREEPILSPYSGLYLKPYIMRDTECFPTWLKLMAEIQLKGNEKDKNFILPSRYPIDYSYVQPSHIPAVNSLCNQFFWPGIDLTESLQYPDFSCVALYKNLIVGFGFIVPNVNINENYLSFIFTRPGWRNAGIARFIMYHLIQTSLGKDITLHVSLTNTALLLYQKFGFKVENVVLGFYEKYLRRDTEESKHAFFCRLER